MKAWASTGARNPKHENEQQFELELEPELEPELRA